MSRPIWKGRIAFGLVNIPVMLYSAENQTHLNFHLLDSRNNARIHYKRVNESTGKEVPWDKIVKAYEFEKENYVIINEKEFEKTAAENFETVEIESFIDNSSLDPIYFSKPYYLVPSKHGEKGYVLLRETLIRTQKIGIAKVVIRTREYLAAVLPYHNMLVLNILRFNTEIKKPDEFKIPTTNVKSYKLTEKELDMAEKLIKNMTAKWNPKQYNDENQKLLSDWINHKIKKKKSVVSHMETEEKKLSDNKVVDFMSLLEKSIATKTKAKRETEKNQTPKRRKNTKNGAKGELKKIHSKR